MPDPVGRLAAACALQTPPQDGLTDLPHGTGQDADGQHRQGSATERSPGDQVQRALLVGGRAAAGPQGQREGEAPITP